MKGKSIMIALLRHNGNILCESIAYISSEMGKLELQSTDNTWYTISMDLFQSESYVKAIFRTGKIDLSSYDADILEYN